MLKSNLKKAHNMRYGKAKAARKALLLEGEDARNLYHWLIANFG